MRVHELPPALVASTIHYGAYNRIGEAHEAVMTWIEAHDYRVAGADREINLYNKTPIRLDDPTYLTEIQYPVERAV
jgi:effector-binding domain-containing protein